MNVIVCIKQVPSSTKVSIDPVTNTIVRDARQSVINPVDCRALETALMLKDKYGAHVSVLSMGIPAVKELLLDALSRGADKAYLLTDRAFAGSDTLATSYALSLAIRSMGKFDLVLCGKMAVDGDTAQIGPELAQHLDIFHVTDVSDISEVSSDHIICHRSCADSKQVIKSPLPCLLTINDGAPDLHFSSISGVRRSLSLPYSELNAAALNADTSRTGLAGSPTQVVKTYTPERSSNAVKISGNAKEQVKQLIRVIEEVM